jgi:hypothetical protein
MVDLSLFKQYLELETELMNLATKEELTQCGRFLAIKLARYELTYGELPLDENMEDISTNKPTEAQIALLNRGMDNMVGMLGNLIHSLDDRKPN